MGGHGRADHNWSPPESLVMKFTLLSEWNSSRRSSSGTAKRWLLPPQRLMRVKARGVVAFVQLSRRDRPTRGSGVCVPRSKSPLQVFESPFDSPGATQARIEDLVCRYDTRCLRNKSSCVIVLRSAYLGMRWARLGVPSARERSVSSRSLGPVMCEFGFLSAP